MSLGVTTFCDQSRYCQKTLILQNVFGMVCLSLTWKINVVVDTEEVEWVIFPFQKKRQSKELGAWSSPGFLLQVTSWWGSGAIPAPLPHFCPSHLAVLQPELETKQVTCVRGCSGRYIPILQGCVLLQVHMVYWKVNSDGSPPSLPLLEGPCGAVLGTLLRKTSVISAHFLLKELLDFSS